MTHTRELSRQLYPPRGHDWLDDFRGQGGRRWQKKERRRHVRRWNQRETIREYDWYAEELREQEQEDRARWEEYEREYWETRWYDDPYEESRYTDNYE